MKEEQRVIKDLFYYSSVKIFPFQKITLESRYDEGTKFENQDNLMQGPDMGILMANTIDNTKIELNSGNLQCI